MFLGDIAQLAFSIDCDQFQQTLQGVRAGPRRTNRIGGSSCRGRSSEAHHREPRAGGWWLVVLPSCSKTTIKGI